MRGGPSSRAPDWGVTPMAHPDVCLYARSGLPRTIAPSPAHGVMMSRPPSAGDVQPLLTYVGGRLAPLYRAIIAVFVVRADRFEFSQGLSTEAIAAELSSVGFHQPVEPAQLEQALAQLSHWGNLAYSQDLSAAATLAEFEHKEYRYHLTEPGRQAAEMIAALEGALGESGALQSVMVRSVADKLAALVEALDAGAVSPDALYTTFDELNHTFAQLASKAQSYMSEVAQTLRQPDLDPQRFAQFKADTLVYVDRFLGDLDRVLGEVVESMERVEAHGLHAVLRLAATADKRPVPAGEEDPAETWVRLQLGRWAGMATWFRGESGEQARAEDLRDAARVATVGILKALDRLVDRINRPHSRSEDLLTLARWFNRADDDEAHALFKAAFGLHSSRHLTDSLDDPEAVRASTSWPHAPALTVTVALRAQGRSEYVRKPGASDMSGVTG